MIVIEDIGVIQYKICFRYNILRTKINWRILGRSLRY